MMKQGNRKLTAFFTSIGVYLVLMLTVIIFLKPGNLSLESFSISLATGIMAISYGFYASNAYVHAKEGQGRKDPDEIGRQGTGDPDKIGNT